MSFPQVESLTPDAAHKLIHEIIEAGYAWAEKDAEASIMEESKKTLLATLVLEYSEGAKATGGKGMSKAEADIRALADPRYADHVAMMIDIRKEANRSRVKYDSGRAYMDMIRSVNATRRAETTLR